jgi:glycosyltransferase involved in cell wall biosynthesis
VAEKKLRVVIAGQLPPPVGGQNLMIEKALVQFQRCSACLTEHLPFFFTPHVTSARRVGIGKIVELFRVIKRLLRLRLAGPIDVLLYPAGGPQTVPLIRDLLLFPWMLTVSRRVILQFHAAGIGDQLDRRKIIPQLVASLYRKAFAAIVSSSYNRRDTDLIGIRRALVVPYHIQDEFDPELVRRNSFNKLRLLYVGHLCVDKGTPQLLKAYALLRKHYPGSELELVGECLPPFTRSDLNGLIEQFQLGGHVHLPGVLTGRAKAEAFGRADLFVFPTIAPYESFGLVLAEAMSWELPIVATDWRGNADVLTTNAGAICFPVSAELAADIAAALTRAFEQHDRWRQWGRINRAIFEEHYRDTATSEWLVGPILSLLEERALLRDD